MNPFPPIDVRHVQPPAELKYLLQPHPATPIFNATLLFCDSDPETDVNLRGLKRAKWPVVKDPVS